MITARLATSEDSRDLWIWRNDPVTRAMSITTEEVAWDVHTKWYEKSLSNPNRLLFIGTAADNNKIGMCRFDLDEEKDCAEVSINLNPHHRGQKLSEPFLTCAIELFRKNHAVPLKATIRKNNTASIRCFTKTGFQFDTEDAEYNYYTLL